MEPEQPAVSTPEELAAFLASMTERNGKWIDGFACLSKNNRVIAYPPSKQEEIEEEQKTSSSSSSSSTGVSRSNAVAITEETKVVTNSSGDVLMDDVGSMQTGGLDAATREKVNMIMRGMDEKGRGMDEDMEGIDMEGITHMSSSDVQRMMAEAEAASRGAGATSSSASSSCSSASSSSSGVVSTTAAPAVAEKDNSNEKDNSVKPFTYNALDDLFFGRELDVTPVKIGKR
jgi:hypothetical protein